MMHEHDRSHGYGRQMRYEDERPDDEYRSRDYDRGEWSDRDAHSSRYEEESSPYSRRETRGRLRGNTVASVWEITAQSRTSFDDAIRYGIERARRTLRHIRGAWVQGQEVLLRNNEIYAYRVQLKLTYVLDDT